MKRSSLALCVMLVVLVLAGCQPALDTNRNAALAAASPAKETFDPKAIEAEVIRIEKQWADANKTHKTDDARQFLADDAVIVYPDGSTATKADEIRTIESGAFTAEAFDMLDPKVTVLDADAAFITGRSILKNASYKDPSQKKPLNISGEYVFLDVYARRNGKWQVVASHVTKVANPAPAASPTPTK